MATALLPFTRLFITLAMCIRGLLTEFATTLDLVEQAFWRVPLFTKWIGASSFEVILARPSKHSTAGTLSSGTSGSRRISFILLHERIWRRIRLCHFCTLINIVTKTAIVYSGTLPVGLPLPWPRRFFHNFRFWRQILYFENLAPYFFLPLSSICDNQVQLSSDESPYCTIPIRSWAYQTLVFLILYNPSKMSSDGIFVIDNKIPSHFESNSWISSFRRPIVNRSA